MKKTATTTQTPIQTTSKPFEEMTIAEAHRAITADYLHQLAELVERGAINAFDLCWNQEQMLKPQGRLAMASTFLVAPVEAEYMEKVEEYRARHATSSERGPISVADVSEDLKDHPQCPPDRRDDCALCNTKLS